MMMNTRKSKIYVFSSKYKYVIDDSKRRYFEWENKDDIALDIKGVNGRVYDDFHSKISCFIS